MNKYRLWPNFLFVLFLTFSLAGCGDEETSESGGTADTPDPVAYMWVSTQVEDGDFGGIARANEICEQDATDDSNFASPVTTHRAVLVTDDFDPRDEIFDDDREVKRPDGTLITANYSNYFDHTATLDNGVSASNSVWFGLLSNDTPPNCTNWSIASGGSNGATLGASATAGFGRILSIASTSCAASRPFLCISY